MDDVNLIPADRLAKKLRRERLRVWTIICGTYVISLAMLVGSARFFWGNAAVPVTEELNSTTERIERYNSTILDLQQRLTKATAELEAGKVISCQPDWSKLLILISDELGDEIVLRNFQLATLNKDHRDVTNNIQQLLSSSSPGVFLAERRYRLELNGFGRTQTAVSQFVLRLERMQIFDSVRLVNSYRQAFLNEEAVAFGIECNI